MYDSDGMELTVQAFTALILTLILIGLVALRPYVGSNVVIP